MHKLLPGCLFAAAALCLVPQPASAETKTVVDCTFAGDANGALPITVPEDAQGTLPLTAPTRAAVTGEGGKLFVRSQGVEGYGKPVVVFVPGAHPQNPEGASGIKLIWDLREAGLGPGGVYDLEFTVIPEELPINGGGRMKFTILDADGQHFQDVVLHVTELPTASFAGETFGSPMKRIPVGNGQVIPVKFHIDLVKNQWTLWVDGQPLAEDQPLPGKLTDVYPQLTFGGFDFGSEGGLGDKVGGSYALGAIKLTRTDE